MNDFVRQDILKLLPMLVLPDIIRDGFVDVGIVNKKMQTIDDEEIAKYEFNTDSFKNIPDKLISILYSELESFCIWHREAVLHINKPGTQSDIPLAASYEKCRQHIMACHCLWHRNFTTDELDNIAHNFIRQFANQWRKHQ